MTVPGLSTRLRPLLRSPAPGWAVLGTLLVATLAAAAIHERAGWRGAVAGEATYLMQAESLAFDLDLAYERADYDRFLARWRQSPTDLDLVSGSAGRRITFDRPFPYALYLAPFLRLSRHGFALANALLLTLAAWLATRALRRRIGWRAPLLTALLIFGSVTFAYVFLATGDVFLLALTVMATALVAGERPSPRAWLGAGLLLAIPAATSPLLLALPLALALFADRGGRGRFLAALAGGLVALVLVQWLAGGGLGPVGASDARFTVASGFPRVDFGPGEWSENVRRLDAVGFEGAPRLAWGLDPLLWLWNLLYLFFGQAIGLVPYFLPLIVLVAAGLPFRVPGIERRDATPDDDRLVRALWLAAGLWLAALLLLRPFDLFGGPGAIGNRLFLPLYGALWLATTRAPRAPWLATAAFAAGFFLAPLWRAPGEEPITRAGGMRHVSELAARFLPYETSQRWLPGGATAEHGGLWLRPLSEHVWIEPGKGRLMVEGAAGADLLIASTLPIDVARLELGPEAPATIEVLRGELGERLLEPDGGIAFRVELPAVAPRHPLWWTPQRQYLYRVAFRLPTAGDEPLAFELIGERRTSGDADDE